MADVKFSLRMDRHLLDATAEQANRELRSVNQLINVAVIRYLAAAEAAVPVPHVSPTPPETSEPPSASRAGTGTAQT